MEKIRATQLAGLEKFAGVVFEGAQGKYTLDEYAYFDDGSMFSTTNFLSTAGVIAAGAEQSLFSTPVGANGQGFAAGTNLTLADTNMERGWDGGKAPANQAYVAVAGGFDVYRVNADQDTDLAGSMVPILNAQDMFQIISGVTWSWNVGGDASPRLNYDPIKFWPLGAGMSAIGAGLTEVLGVLEPVVQPITDRTASTTVGAFGQLNQAINFAAITNGGPASVMRKFVFPLFFPPMVAVDCRVRFQNGVTLQNTGADSIRIAFHLRGYKLNRIV